MKQQLKKGDRVKIIGGSFEYKDLRGDEGVIDSIDKSGIVYVKLLNDLHCFNDYHLMKI